MKRLLVFTFAVLMTAAVPKAVTIPSINVQDSSITVYVYKQGLFSFLGDNHVIDAPIARASYDTAKDSVALSVDVAKMRVVDPGLSPGKRAAVQSNMVGPHVLDAAAYPTIDFQSTGILRDPNGTLTVAGNLQMHGKARPVTFQLRNERPGHLTGFLNVRQSEFGITPIKIAGGAVSVKDDVRVQFDIAIV